MLNRHSRQFLNFLKRSESCFENDVILYNYISDHWHESIHDIYAVLKYLEEQNYIRVSRLGKTPVGVALTELGKHPYQFSVVKFRAFLFKSVLVPIVLSFVTTMITLWLKGELNWP